MSVLGNIVGFAACVATGGWGGHEFKRHGDYLVCEHCGHKVKAAA